MVGAITTLIIIVAVFLAYNANNGLPFVPIYRVSAEICDAARLGPNNEVRIGGNRVGVVESIDTVAAPPSSGCQAADGSSASTVAKLNLKLDKSAEPLPADSTIRVRYRSSFGLKYLEISRGTSEPGPAGGRRPCRSPSRSDQVEFDDIYNTFDTATRENSRRVLQGFGDAFAGPRRLAEPGDRAPSTRCSRTCGRSPRRSRIRPPSWSASSPSSPTPPGSSRRSRWTTPSSSPTARSPSARSPRTRRRCATRSRGARRPSRPGSARCRSSSPFLPTSPSSRACCARASATCALSLPVLNQAVSARRQGAAADGADEPRPPGRDGRARTSWSPTRRR